MYFDVNFLFQFPIRFHHQRVPLVILVCGTACVGKSTIATQLAQRLNLPNVLQVSLSYIFLQRCSLSLTHILVWMYMCACVCTPAPVSCECVSALSVWLCMLACTVYLLAVSYFCTDAFIIYLFLFYRQIWCMNYCAPQQSM